LNLDVRVDAPRLPKRAILQRDIDADDPLAMREDRQQIFQRAIVRIETWLLIADSRGATDQQANRVEQALDVVDRFVAEALDKAIGIGTRDPVVRQVGEADDRQKPRHRQNDEQRDDARP